MIKIESVENLEAFTNVEIMDPVKAKVFEVSEVQEFSPPEPENKLEPPEPV